MQASTDFAGGQIFQVREDDQPYEIQLQSAWDRLPAGHKLRTNQNSPVEILSPGTWNVEAGPDFRNAKLRVDNTIVTGDIEIHYRASDWNRHGHQHDPAYDDVILHVVCVDDKKQGNCPDLPLAVITPAPEESPKKFRQGKCIRYFAQLDDDRLHEMLVDAGRERFRRKSDTLLKSMLSHGAEYAINRNLFDAFGYKKNRDGFVTLFDRFQEHTEENRQAHPAAILWGESGMLPDCADTVLDDDMKTFAQNCWETWWKLRRQARPAITWRRSGVRPVNTPERRLAGLVQLLANCDGSPLLTFVKLCQSPDSEKITIRKMLKTLNTHDSLWDNYNSFQSERNTPAAVIGRERALEILVNVILPGVHAWARMKSDKKLEQEALTLWLSLPKTEDNRIVRLAANQWLMPADRAKSVFKDAASGQGVIHLFREYCESTQTDCASCLINNSM